MTSISMSHRRRSSSDHCGSSLVSKWIAVVSWVGFDWLMCLFFLPGLYRVWTATRGVVDFHWRPFRCDLSSSISISFWFLPSVKDCEWLEPNVLIGRRIFGRFACFSLGEMSTNGFHSRPRLLIDGFDCDNLSSRTTRSSWFLFFFKIRFFYRFRRLVGRREKSSRVRVKQFFKNPVKVKEFFLLCCVYCAYHRNCFGKLVRSYRITRRWSKEKKGKIPFLVPQFLVGTAKWSVLAQRETF